MEINIYASPSESLALQLVELFRTTFFESEGEVEANLIANLVRELIHDSKREDRLLVVGHDGAELVGCIIYTPLFPEDGKYKVWLLSPVAVHPSFQKRGMGQKLISSGNEYLKEQGVQVVCTYGDIRFYSKSGFEVTRTDEIPAPYPLSYPEGWLSVKLDPSLSIPESKSMSCIPAFEKPEIW